MENNSQWYVCSIDNIRPKRLSIKATSYKDLNQAIFEPTNLFDSRERYEVAHFSDFRWALLKQNNLERKYYWPGFLIAGTAYQQLQEFMQDVEITHSVDCEGYCFHHLLLPRYDLYIPSDDFWECKFKANAFEQISEQVHIFSSNKLMGFCASGAFFERIKELKLSGLDFFPFHPISQDESEEYKQKPYLKKGTIKNYHPEKRLDPPPNLVHWQTPEQLQQAFNDSGLNSLFDPLKPYCHNGIQLIPTQITPDEHFDIGESKFGGQPDLPPEIDWKKLTWRHEGSKRYLHCVAQFNLNDLKPHDTQNRLPNSGMLYIFCDIDDEVACELQDATPKSKCYRVLHWDGDMSTLQRTKQPKRDMQPLYSTKLRFEHSLMVPMYSPDDGSELFTELGIELDESQLESYLNMLVAPGPFRLLGNPSGFEEAMFIDGKAQQLFLQMESLADMALFFGDEGRWFVYGEPQEVNEQTYDELCATIEFG